MKHALLVIFLAGCPDDPGAPVTYDPHDTCVGFGVTFQTLPYADASYFSYSKSWAGETGGDVKPIAVGGIAYITAAGAPYIDQTTPEFTAAVTGPALAIDPSSHGITTAAVIGAEAGTADLCIYDHGSTELHDGIRLHARPVTAMFVTPAASYFQAWERQPAGATYPFSAWKMHTGLRRTITVALLGDRDWRLVDHGMTIEAALDDDPYLTPVRETWDSISRDIDRPGTLHVRATLRDGAEWSSQVDFVDRVDALEMQPLGYGDLAHLRSTTGWVSLCFNASLAGTPVFGAPYRFEATPQVALHETSILGNCVSLEPIDPGHGALSVSVDDRVLEIPFTVDPTGS